MSSRQAERKAQSRVRNVETRAGVDSSKLNGYEYQAAVKVKGDDVEE